MSARSTEIARETAVYRCEKCLQSVPVRKGVQIVDCPNCGGASFHTGLRFLQNPMGSL